VVVAVVELVAVAVQVVIEQDQHFLLQVELHTQ
jgi:hypothetical protein